MTLTLSWRRAEEGGRDKNGEWNNHSPPPPAFHPSPSSWASIDRDLCISRGLAENGGKESWDSTLVRGLRKMPPASSTGHGWGNNGVMEVQTSLGFCWLIPWAEAGHCALGMFLKEL